MRGKAFTLAEVLITLVVIGIISAIAVPILVNQYKWKQYKSGLIKAQSMLNNSVRKFRSDEGYYPSCYLHSYGEDCKKLYNSFLQNMNVIKKCPHGKAHSKGCIPKYEGIESIKHANNSPPEELEAYLKTCGGFAQEKILTTASFVTADGMIFFPYHISMTSIMSVDVNGQKGPNKWGHDVHVFYSLNDNNVPVFMPSKPDIGCPILDARGKYGHSLIYGKS